MRKEDMIEHQLFEEKRVALAPCGFLSWSEAAMRFVPDYPVVECELRCETCGWNPRVQKERIERRFGKHDSEGNDDNQPPPEGGGA